MGLFNAVVALRTSKDIKRGGLGWKPFRNGDGERYLTALNRMVESVQKGETVVALCQQGQNRYSAMFSHKSLSTELQPAYSLLPALHFLVRSACTALAVLLIVLYKMREQDGSTLKDLLPRPPQHDASSRLLKVLLCLRLVVGCRRDRPSQLVKIDDRDNQESTDARHKLETFNEHKGTMLQSLVSLVFSMLPTPHDVPWPQVRRHESDNYPLSVLGKLLVE